MFLTNIIFIQEINEVLFTEESKVKKITKKEEYENLEKNMNITFETIEVIDI